jgi:hypothetical protein
MTLGLALVHTAYAAEPATVNVELNSDRIGIAGLTLPESTKPVFRIGLEARVDKKGEGSGALVLDVTGLPSYDEFGFPTAAIPVPPIKLGCTIKYVKKTTVKVLPVLPAPESPEPAEQPEGQVEVEWRLYAVTGPKITSKLSLATDGVSRRLLVQGSVTATKREERVYNVVLHDSELFVANDYLARSKPPAVPEPSR